MLCMLNPLAVLAVGLVVGKRSRFGSIAERPYLQIIAGASIKSFISVSAALFGGAGVRTGRRWSWANLLKMPSR